MRIKDLSTRVAALLSGNAWFGVDNGSKVEKVAYSEIVKQGIENYTGTSLAGSNQSVKSAVDALNSKTPSNPTVLTATDDMDTLKAPGFYTCVNGVRPLHCPEGNIDNASVVVTKGRQNLDAFQLWWSANANAIYTRRISGSAIGTWAKQPTRAEMDALNDRVTALENQ